MSEIRVNNIIDEAGTGAPTFPNGAIVTGSLVATASTATNAAGLTGTPNITVGTVGCGNVTSSGDVTGVNATFSGNLTVNGTTTTIDTAVTDVDSLVVDGQVTVGAGLTADGFKIENGYQDTSTGLTGRTNVNFESGHIQRFSNATSGNYFFNFRLNSSNSPTLSSRMDVGDVTTGTVIVASSSHYCLNTLEVDGSTSNITTSWIGGAAPSAANGSGFDIYSFTIMKTAATPAYHIIANATSAA